MASLNIDFSYDDNVKSSLKKAKRALQTRIDDYSGIKRNLNNISSSTGNLSTANSYIQKKINHLQTRYEKLDNFQGAIETFNRNAEDADKRVAKRINTETNQFYKREGIKTGILYSIGCVIGAGAKWLAGTAEKIIDSVGEFFANTWETVKKWYEDNKHWIDIVVDVIGVVAAVVGLIATIVSGGTLLALVVGIGVGVWGVAKSTADLVYDSMAYGAYKEGDMEKYEELSNSGLKEAMTQYMGDVGEYIYYGMEAVSAIYGIYKIGKTVGTVFKDYKTLYTNDSFMVAKLSDGLKKQIIISDIKNTIFKAVGITNLDAATGQLKVVNIISGINWTVSTGQKIFKTDSAGSFVMDTIKITSSFKKGYSNVKDIISKISNSKMQPIGNAAVYV